MVGFVCNILQYRKRLRFKCVHRYFWSRLLVHFREVSMLFYYLCRKYRLSFIPTYEYRFVDRLIFFWTKIPAENLYFCIRMTHVQRKIFLFCLSFLCPFTAVEFPTNLMWVLTFWKWKAYRYKIFNLLVVLKCLPSIQYKIYQFHALSSYIPLQPSLISLNS